MGVLDISKAIFFATLGGGSGIRVLQSVASGALGRTAYAGGLITAALGLGLHFLIAFSVFTAYYLTSARFPALVRHALVLGPLYGVATHIFMQFVVFPLSAIGPVPHRLAGMVDGILTHIICVGLPTGVVTREARNGASSQGKR